MAALLELLHRRWTALSRGINDLEVRYLDAVHELIANPVGMIRHLSNDVRVKRAFSSEDDEAPEMIRSLRYAREVRERARLALRYGRLGEAEDQISIGESEYRFLESRLTGTQQALNQGHDLFYEDPDSWNIDGEHFGMPRSYEDSPWKWTLLRYLVPILPDVRAAIDLRVMMEEDAVRDAVGPQGDHLEDNLAGTADLAQSSRFHSPPAELGEIAEENAPESPEVSPRRPEPPPGAWAFR